MAAGGGRGMESERIERKGRGGGGRGRRGEIKKQYHFAHQTLPPLLLYSLKLTHPPTHSHLSHPPLSPHRQALGCQRKTRQQSPPGWSAVASPHSPVAQLLPVQSAQHSPVCLQVCETIVKDTANINFQEHTMISIKMTSWYGFVIS